MATRSARNTLPTSDRSPGTVRRDQLENRALVAAVDAEINLGRRPKHAHLARRAARHGRRRILGLLEHAPHAAFDVVDARSVGDHGAVVLEHHIGLQAEAIGAGDQPCINHIQPHLIEHAGGSRKAAQAPRRVGQHGGAAAIRELPHGDQRCVIVGAGARPAVPCARQSPPACSAGNTPPSTASKPPRLASA